MGARVELVELELLISVAETGSLGQAAVRHALSQPAVSMRMTGLERSLGLRLLRRDSSGTRLTPAGEEIVAAARPILAAGETLAAVAAKLRAESASRLRVAASFTVAEYLAPAWIEAFSHVPQVALAFEVLNSSKVIEAVEQHRVDVGFVEGVDRELSGIRTEIVTTDELVVVVTAAHPWHRRGRPVSGDELAAQELIVRERGSGTREVLEEALAPWGGIRSRLELGSSAAILAAARRGKCPAVISRLAVDAVLLAGHLRLVEVEGIDLSRTIRAVWPADADLGPLGRRLLDLARLPSTRH